HDPAVDGRLSLQRCPYLRQGSVGLGCAYRGSNLRKSLGNLRQMNLELLENHVNTPGENATIPKITTTRQKLFRRFEIRLLHEAFDLGDFDSLELTQPVAELDPA